MLAIQAHETTLFARLLDGLERIAGVRIFGIIDPDRLAERTPTVSITLSGVSPRDAAAALGRRGITAWDGDFYAQGLIERLGQAESGGVLRLGIVHIKNTLRAHISKHLCRSRNGIIRHHKNLACRP